jgi:hypothetical protein
MATKPSDTRLLALIRSDARTERENDGKLPGKRARFPDVQEIRRSRAHRRSAGQMTLARGSVKGFEHDRMVMLFSMMDGDREVCCAVSSAAMDDLERGVKAKPDQRDDQFLRLRDRIEQCASRKFLAGEFEGTPRGIILRSMDFRG